MYRKQKRGVAIKRDLSSLPRPKSFHEFTGPKFENYSGHYKKVNIQDILIPKHVFLQHTGPHSHCLHSLSTFSLSTKNYLKDINDLLRQLPCQKNTKKILQKIIVIFKCTIKKQQWMVLLFTKVTKWNENWTKSTHIIPTSRLRWKKRVRIPWYLTLYQCKDDDTTVLTDKKFNPPNS